MFICEHVCGSEVYIIPGILQMLTVKPGFFVMNASQAVLIYFFLCVCVDQKCYNPMASAYSCSTIFDVNSKETTFKQLCNANKYFNIFSIVGKKISWTIEE